MRLKTRKCQLVPLTGVPTVADLACWADCQRRASPAWQAFQAEQSGKYMWVFLGQSAAERSWAGPMRRYTERARELVRAGMPAVALQVHFVSRVHSLVLSVAGLGAYPKRLDGVGRNIMCQIVRLPVCCMPPLGHLELGLVWGCPLLPSIRGTNLLELHMRPQRTEQQRRPTLTLVTSAQDEHRPLVQKALGHEVGHSAANPALGRCSLASCRGAPAGSGIGGCGRGAGDGGATGPALRNARRGGPGFGADLGCARHGREVGAPSRCSDGVDGRPVAGRWTWTSARWCAGWCVSSARSGR